MDFSKYSGMELIHIYGELLSQMRRDGLIRSKNVTGDLCEYAYVIVFPKVIMRLSYPSAFTDGLMTIE